MKHKTRKDKRQPPTGGKAVSYQCRNHGKCSWCTSDRTYKNQKRIDSIKFIENEN